MSEKNNVTNMKPRRKIVHHMGLHGVVEYHPARKMWSYMLKLVYRIKHSGEHAREEEATLELKRLMGVAADGNAKNVRSED